MSHDIPSLTNHTTRLLFSAHAQAWHRGKPPRDGLTRTDRQATAQTATTTPHSRHTHTQATRIAASQTRPYSQPHTTARIPRATLRHADTYTPPPREGYPRARRGAAATLALPLDAIWGYYGKTVRFCGECCSFTFSSLQRLPQRLL